MSRILLKNPRNPLLLALSFCYPFSVMLGLILRISLIMQHIKHLVLAFSFVSLITVPAMSMEEPSPDDTDLENPKYIRLQPLKKANNNEPQERLNTTSPQPSLKDSIPASSPSINIPKSRFNDSSSDDVSSNDAFSEDSASEDGSPKNTPSIPQNLRSKSFPQQSIKPPLEDVFTLEDL